MAFDCLALSLSAWGKDQKNPRLCVQHRTVLNKSHTDTQSLTPVANPLQQSNYHIPLANSLSAPQKAVLCKAALLRFFRSAYHPHSIDQGFRYLRNDCLQCGGLSFPMPIDDLSPSLNKYIYIYISRHKNSTSCTLFHQSNVPGNKAAVNFPESHPISHCKPELDQKAGILA